VNPVKKVLCAELSSVYVKMAGAVKFTLEEQVFLLTAYMRHNGEYQTIFEEFAAHFLDTMVLNRSNVQRLFNKFQQTGSIPNAPCSGCPVTMTMEANMEVVMLLYEEEANLSARLISAALDISDRSLHQMLKRLRY